MTYSFSNTGVGKFRRNFLGIHLRIFNKSKKLTNKTISEPWQKSSLQNMGIIFFGDFGNGWKNRVLNFPSQFQNFTEWIQLFFRLSFVSKLFHGQFHMTQSKGGTWAGLPDESSLSVVWTVKFKPPTDKCDLWLSSRRYLPSSKSVLQLTQAMNSGKNQIFETDLSFVQLRRYCVHFLFIRSKIDILLNATPDKPQSYDSFRSVWSPSRSVKVDLVENFWTNCLLEHIISLTFW